MNKRIFLFSIRFVIIILVVIIFYFLMKNSLIAYVHDKNDVNESFENYNNPFKYKASNTRILYRNVGELPWNRHSINSSIPYDVKVVRQAQKAYYYEFDNNTYDKKLKEVFKSKCEELIIAVEGTNWSKWKNPKTLKDDSEISKILRYYNIVFDHISNQLNTSNIMTLPENRNNRKIQIVHDILNRYRLNLDNTLYYMFDIEMILYREGKLQGKHIKLVAITNGIKVNVILSRIVGVVNEDNIVLYPYVANDAMEDINDFEVFIPEGKSMKDTENKITDYDTLDKMKDDTVYSEIEDIMYKKLLDEYNAEDVDISNNNYKPKKEELVKHVKKCFT